MEEKIKIGETSIEYLQPSDDYAKDGNSRQSIKITAQPTLLHLYEKGENDFYFVIETSRFVFNNISEFVSILKDFEKRLKEIK